MDKELFKSDPRDYALGLVEDGLISYHALAMALLVYMSHDDVRGAMDANEIAPRFIEDEDEDA